MGVVQRVQRNPLLLLVVGAVLIVAAAILVWLNINARHAPQNVARENTSAASDIQSSSQILVAARAIPRGAVIAAEDVTLHGVAAPLPAGSFTSASAAIGRVATADILPSQIILGDALSASRQAAGVSALVETGARAFAVRIAEDQIVGGFLRVNDRVDVFATLPDAVFPQEMNGGRKAADQSRTTLLLQNVAILAVGEKLQTKGAEALNGARTVTLAIGPDAVARLALAERLGKITLAIRNPADKDVTPETTVSLSDLGTMTAEAAPAAAEAPIKKAAAPSGHRITIYSGATTSTVTTSR
ncbi:MAG TPA: Flp pilus assembly protein CpaB [Parvibaculum sp.]|jgi:pilus assembly protein CpaB